MQHTCRRVLDLHAQWKAAMERMKRPCNLAMWSVIVGAATKQAQRDLMNGVKDVKETVEWHSKNKEELKEEDMQNHKQEKKRLAAIFKNLKYFAYWSPFFNGRELERIPGASGPEKMVAAARMEDKDVDALELFTAQENSAVDYKEHPPTFLPKNRGDLGPKF